MDLYCNGRTVENATWADVEAVLPKLKGEAELTLVVAPPPQEGPEDLEVESENGNYMASMAYAEPGRGGESYYDDAARGGEKVSIGGYRYDPSDVTRDYDRIVRIISEFYHNNGHVSPELWEP